MTQPNELETSSPEQFSVRTVPEGCDPIREDEFERLPDYAIELIIQSMNGVLEHVTHEQLVASMANFFENSSRGEILISESTTITSHEEVDNHEHSRGSDSAACGALHSSEQ